MLSNTQLRRVGSLLGVTDRGAKSPAGEPMRRQVSGRSGVKGLPAGSAWEAKRRAWTGLLQVVFVCGCRADTPRSMRPTRATLPPQHTLPGLHQVAATPYLTGALPGLARSGEE